MMEYCGIIFDFFSPDLGFYGGHIQANYKFPIIHLETFHFTEAHLGPCQTSVFSPSQLFVKRFHHRYLTATQIRFHLNITNTKSKTS